MATGKAEPTPPQALYNTAHPSSNDDIRSVNCVVGKRKCDYAPPSLPLNERRRQQRDFPCLLVWQLPKSETLDPFDSLPIDMTVRSRELFYYCQWPLISIPPRMAVIHLLTL